jgi:hypothetical protein
MQHVDDSTRGPMYKDLYSGDAQHWDDPGSYNVKDHGVIPQGPYIIGPAYDGKKGPVTMNLYPDLSNPTTYVFGRDLFRIHGGKSSCDRCASAGCIVASHVVRDAISGSGDTKLWVVP